MSRESVRGAIVEYLTNANITLLTDVLPFPPKLTVEGDFYNGNDPNHKSGCIIFLWIESERENRIAVGGATNGRKMVEYNFLMDCYFRSTDPLSENAAQENEEFLDSLIAAIRASRTAGTSDGTIFAWGEGASFGGPDIEVVSYYPRSLNGAMSVTQTYSTVRVVVMEEIDS